MSVEKRTSWFFILCASEGVLALAYLFLIPSEGGTFSPARLVLILSVVASISWWIYGSLHPSRALRILSHPRVILPAALSCVCTGLFLFLLRYLDPERLLPYYVRSSPLLWHVFVLVIQILIFSLVRQHGFHPEALQKNKSLYAASAIIFCALLLVLILVTLTGLGITKDAVYWGEPGVAIPFWLFGLAILIGTSFLAYEWMLPNPDGQRVLNILMPVTIWLVASTLWLGVPISYLRNSFYAPITPPYTTPFPYSDAGFYDYLAQSLLVGADYLGGVPPRPLYVTFLALLHVLFGQDYVKIIAAQAVVLALFPVVLYWLGTRLHSRPAGLVIALFAIFRELTSLWLASDIRTSVTKMFLTDFPTALSIALVSLVTLRWLERRDNRSALTTGGSFGLLLLMRTQSAVILPILLAFSWFVYRKDPGGGWSRAWLGLGGMLILTIAPWMLRNYQTTGRLALDYTSPASVIYSQLSGESITSGFVTGEGAGEQLAALLARNFGVVSGFVANHFLNTQIGGLLVLPLAARFDGLLASVNAYWVEWDGELAWYNLALIILYLAIIAMGLGAAWKRLKWIGLTPLAFSVGYALSNGIARYSSWRYNLPADWTAYFYFGIGVIELFMLVAGLFGREAVRIVPVGTPELKMERLKPATLVHVLTFVFIGSLPWLAEGVVPPRYADQSIPAIAQQAGSVSSAPSEAEIEAFATQPETYVGIGRVLYPRFFPRDKGLASANPWPNYAVRDFSRFGFLLMNQELFFVDFPSRADSATIPHATEAVVLGCLRADHVEAHLIVLPELDVAYASAPLTEPCSQ